ncbi:MAG: hypothetical protein H6Q28_1093 [Bacteroidetes bacterium]|jgi:hypothetical protein|nr:hypothetical protein [Bacteroidota bacterium]
MKRMVMIMALAGMLAGCAGAPEDLVVVDKALKAQANTATSGLSEFGASGGGQAASTLYWVEGRVQNKGPQDYTGVVIRFRVKESGSNKVLTAELEKVPAGKTVAFRTTTLQTYTAISLLPDPPEIEATTP